MKKLFESLPPARSSAAAGARRIRYGLRAVVIILCASAAVLFSTLIASRLPARLDLTEAASHPLSPRTVQLLNQLDAGAGDHEVIIAANLDAVDPSALQQTRDAVDTMARASSRLRISILDTRAGGSPEYDAVLHRLAARNAGRIGEVTSVLDAARQSCLQHAESLRGCIGDLDAILTGLPLQAEDLASQRSFLDNKIAVARIIAQDLETAAKRAADAMTQTVGPTPIPPLDQAERAMSLPLASLANELSSSQRGLAAIADQPSTDEQTRARCRALAMSLGEQRDLAARAAESLRTLGPLPVLAVARTLERDSAAIIIGPESPGGNSMTAIDLGSLLPPRGTMALNLPRPNYRTRAEELIASGLASLNAADRPIVALVHGEGITIGPDFEPFAAMVRRLSLHGIDTVEWATAIDGPPPTDEIRRLGAGRPVVYLIVSTSAATADGAIRLKKLSTVVSALVQNGESLLLSVTPSMLPGIGEKDPMTEALGPVGIAVDSGRPLLRSINSSHGRSVAAEFLLVPAPDDQSLSSTDSGDLLSAVVGVPIQLLWPTPLRVTATDGVVVRPLLGVADDDQVWAESDWVRFRQVPISQRAMLPDPPTEDSARDDGKGPWCVALALTRPAHDRNQRLIIVGSNGWFLDAVTQQARSVDGRLVSACPGNLELLEASVQWLAGQDEWISRGAPAFETPLIKSLTSGQLSAIWWMLVVGLPATVLLLGLAYRLFRG